MRIVWLFAVVLSLTCPLAWADGCQPASQLRFTHWMDEKSLINDNIGAVSAIHKDAQGYLWFGGENGLVRFNGTGFDWFRHQSNQPGSLSNSVIWDLLRDRQGRFWVATEAGLNRFDPRAQRFERYDRRSGHLQQDAITSLAEDAQGQLWLGTRAGVVRWDPQRAKAQPLLELGDNAVQVLLPDARGGLWVGTRSQGLAYWVAGKPVRWFREDGHSPLPSLDIRALALDNQGALWVGTFGQGLARLSAEGGPFTHYGPEQGLGSRYVWDLHQDTNGDLWAATEPGGISRYLPTQDRFFASRREPHRPDSLAADKARVIYSDELGDLWVGLFPRGVDQASRYANQFCNYFADAGEQGLSHPSVLTLLPARALGDTSDDLWIGTEDGLNHFHAATGRFRHYRAAPGQPGALQGAAVLALAPAEPGALWLSLWGTGLQRLDVARGQFSLISPEPGHPQGLHTAFIWALLKTQDGSFYLGGETGGVHRWLGGNRFERFGAQYAKDNGGLFVRSLLQTRDGRIWVGTYTGLAEFDPASGSLRPQLRDADGKPRHASVIIALFEDAEGWLWLGTQDGGTLRWHPPSGRLEHYTHQQGLPNNYVAAIQQDAQGVIWVSTLQGLARLQQGRFYAMDKSLGPVANSYNRNATYRSPDGRLWFGSTEGLTQFDPSSLHRAVAPPPRLVLHQLRVFNQLVPVGGHLLPEALPFAPRLELAHDQSMVAVDFYALAYRAPHLNQYAYRLLGFDTRWNLIGNQHTATYTNLPPGDYELQVKAANSLGVWTEQESRLQLRVLPPWWRSVWAYSVYLLLGGLFLWLGVRAQRRHMAFEQTRALNAKLKHIDQLKDAFLANTSHELRTPLNGIIGLAEALQDGSQGELSEPVRHTLKMISSSGRRLSHLINDILDFSKLSKRHLQLYSRPLALAPLGEELLELVRPLVGDKPLQLCNRLSPDLPPVMADANRLQQILLNLLGNAVKFTPSGQITLAAEPVDGGLRLSVSDTGVGINADDLSKIFVEFEQLDNSDTRAQGGTGLGLAITQRLVALHGSSLQVQSQPGEGSCFFFDLPLADSAPQVVEVSEPQARLNTTLDSQLAPVPADGEAPGGPLLIPSDMLGRYTLLVVDDDPINRMVLCAILQLHQHRIIEAASGQDALNILQSRSDIDMVILDVMMPGMTGYEVAMRLRVNYPVHLLPILFLTAKNFSDDLVRGFVAGGNDFLIKPVSKQELLTRVTSHLRLLDINRNLERSLQNRSAEYQTSQYELQALDKIVASLNTEMNPDVLLKTLLNQILLLVKHADGASLWQLCDGGNWVCSSALALQHDRAGEQCFAIDEAFMSALKALGHDPNPIHPLAELKNSALAPLWELFDRPDKTLLAVASFQDSLAGFIALTYSQEPPTIDEHMTAAIQRIKAHATSVMLKASILRDNY
jgi:two-component system, sensor histidine kinase ChiS